MRPRIRRIGLTSKSLFFAILFHLIVAVLLVINLDLPSHVFSARRTEPAPVQASVVSEKEIQKQMEAIRQKEEAKKQKQLEAQKKLEDLLNEKKEEEQRLAAIKKQKEEEQKKAEEIKKKKEEERQQLAKIQQQEEERKKAEAKAEQERKRKEEQEQKRKAEEAKRKKELEAKREREKELQEQLEQERLQQRVNAALAQYIPIIRQKVSRNWNRPAGLRDDIEAHVNVRLSPTGEVLSAQVVKSSGNPVFDRSVENAVLKASPLPIPQEKGVNEEFRNLTLKFKPEELVS